MMCWAIMQTSLCHLGLGLQCTFLMTPGVFCPLASTRGFRSLCKHQVSWYIFSDCSACSCMVIDKLAMNCWNTSYEYKHCCSFVAWKREKRNELDRGDGMSRAQPSRGFAVCKKAPFTGKPAGWSPKVWGGGECSLKKLKKMWFRVEVVLCYGSRK